MRSFGSLQDGMDARSRARQTRSLICWWHARRPVPSLHERPWVSMLSTHAPQLQECAEQMGVPSRKPIATRIDSSSRRSPHDAIGNACSQSPLWGVATARSGPVSISRGVLSMIAVRARWKPDPNSSADVPHQLMAPSRNIVQSKSAVCERSTDPHLL